MNVIQAKGHQDSIPDLNGFVLSLNFGSALLIAVSIHHHLEYSLVNDIAVICSYLQFPPTMIYPLLALSFFTRASKEKAINESAFSKSSTVLNDP